MVDLCALYSAASFVLLLTAKLPRKTSPLCKYSPSIPTVIQQQRVLELASSSLKDADIITIQHPTPQWLVCVTSDTPACFELMASRKRKYQVFLKPTHVKLQAIATVVSHDKSKLHPKVQLHIILTAESWLN